MSESPSIDQLAAQAFDGNQQAWRELYELLNPRLWSTLQRMTRNEHDAAELTQDTWSKIFANHEKYDRSRSFEPWAFTIAMRTFFDFHRKKNGTLIGFDNLPQEVVEESVRVIDKLISQELFEQIRHCMDLLSRDDRRIIHGRYFLDHNHKEIAASLCMSENSIRNKSFRATKKLLDCVEPAVS